MYVRKLALTHVEIELTIAFDLTLARYNFFCIAD